MVNRIWPTAVAGKADNVSSVSASACHIGGPNSVSLRYIVDSVQDETRRDTVFKTFLGGSVWWIKWLLPFAKGEKNVRFGADVLNRWGSGSDLSSENVVEDLDSVFFPLEVDSV